MSTEILAEVISDVLVERERQDRKWGMPQPAMQTPGRALAVLGEEYGEACKAAVEMDAAEMPDAVLVWRDELRKELVQVAAVAVSIIEHLDRGAMDCTPRGYRRAGAADGGRTSGAKKASVDRAVDAVMDSAAVEAALDRAVDAAVDVAVDALDEE